jgi:hypothetical protein
MLLGTGVTNVAGGQVIDQAENVRLKIGSSGKSAKKAPAGTGLVGAKLLRAAISVCANEIPPPREG